MQNTQKPKIRCDLAEKSELERVYHDEEWGRLVKDDAKFFELIVLEGFQAGISWHAVLLKREAMRAAFDGFDAHKISLYGEEQTAKFMQNPALIRNRLKLNSLAANARAFLAVVSEFGSFYDYLWDYLLPKFDPKFDGKPIVNHYENIKQIPATTPLADFIAKEGEPCFEFDRYTYFSDGNIFEYVKIYINYKYYSLTIKD